MPCPKCGAEDRLCVRNGFLFRKITANIGGQRGAKVRRYLCTSPTCGYTGRGKLFNLPEFDEEKPEPTGVSTDERKPPKGYIGDPPTPNVLYCDD